MELSGRRCPGCRKLGSFDMANRLKLVLIYRKIKNQFLIIAMLC